VPVPIEPRKSSQCGLCQQMRSTEEVLWGPWRWVLWCSGALASYVGRGRWLVGDGSVFLGACSCFEPPLLHRRPATTNRKCQVRRYVLPIQPGDASFQICAAVLGLLSSGSAFPSMLSVCFAAISVGASPLACVLPRRSYSNPSFPWCVSEYHDYFMLLSLFWVMSPW
jgi:hypothetical protein